MKKTIIFVILSIFISNQAFCAVTNIGTDNIEIPQVGTNESAKEQDKKTMKASVSVDIKPYYNSWSTIQAYNKINNIGVNIVESNEINKYIKFELSNKRSVNASTDIRNTVTVQRGLLQYVETEDELAFVIGHEIAHAEYNHPKKGTIRNIALISLASAGAGTTVGGAVRRSASTRNIGLALTGASVAAALVDKKLTRNDETRADLRSIDYMVKAGYNPMASISMLHKLGAGSFDFFSDHPSTEKRVVNAYNYINKYYPQYMDKPLDTPAYKSAMNMIKYKTKPVSEYKPPVKMKKNKTKKSSKKTITEENL